MTRPESSHPNGDPAKRAPARPTLAERLREGPCVILDGALGTELERRGARAGLPLWSTHALLESPELVREIHADYARAGAEILTANTFRTQRRTLARADTQPDVLARRDAELCALAVSLAREGAARADRAAVWVAGSAPPLEDCYRNGLVPPSEALEREHARHAENLAAAGVDLILVETMNSVREARVAARAAARTGRPFVASFVCWSGDRLLSGERLDEAIDAVAAALPLAIGVNCLPTSAVGACLPALRAAGPPFAVYANLGAPAEEPGAARSEDCPPDAYAACARSWRAAGARIVGGCCGTTPAHVRALADDTRSEHTGRTQNVSR